MEKIKYFIYYKMPNGSGNNQVELEEPIKDIEDIRVIEKMFKKVIGDDIVISNWIRLW